MFNYLTNWIKIIAENLPFFLHSPRRLNWIYALIKPFKILAEEFDKLRQEFIDKIAYTAQVIYLEKLLNDRFDSINRGIYISNSSRFGNYYLYRKAELKPAFYLYRRWDASIAYIAGEFSVEGNSVYLAVTNNTNLQPSLNTSDWSFYKTVDFMRTKTDKVTKGFVINIPHTLVFDELRLRALVNYYRLAGRNFTINLY